MDRQRATAAAIRLRRRRRRLFAGRQALLGISPAGPEERRDTRLAFRGAAFARWRWALWAGRREYLNSPAAPIHLPAGRVQHAGTVLPAAARRRRIAALRQRRRSR